MTTHGQATQTSPLHVWHLLAALLPLMASCAPATTPTSNGGCQINGDCSQGQICVSSKCIVAAMSCALDSDCPTGSSCTAHACKVNGTGQTTTCAGDIDCEAVVGTTRCDTTAKKCVQCITTLDCGAHQLCTGEACVPDGTSTGCTNNSDCSSSTVGHVCNTSTATCAQCVSTTDCPTSQTCQANVCMTGSSMSGCTQNNDCAGAAGTPYCNSSTARCVECVTANQCISTQTCSTSGTCVNQMGSGGPCTTSGDCLGNPVGSVCEPAIGCVQCTQDTDCTSSGAGTTCASNICSSGGGGGFGSMCTSNAQCASGLVCMSLGSFQICVPSGFGGGGGCTTNADCSSTPTMSICEPNNSVCVQCTADLDCTSSAATPHCDGSNTCVQCLLSTDCPMGTPVCQNGACM